MSYGIHNSEVVDSVAYFPDRSEVSLVMIEERPWTASRERLLEIQDKVHNYVSFALDGQFERAYPEYGGVPIYLDLHCFEPPPEAVTEFLDELNERLARYELKLRVVVVKTIGKVQPIHLHKASWLDRLVDRFRKSGKSPNE